MKTTSLVTRAPAEGCVKIEKLNGRLEMSLTSKGWGWGVEFFCFLYGFQMQTDGVHVVASTAESGETQI